MGVSETGVFLLARDRHPQPWRNGGGWTTEVIGEPRNPAIDNFAWRISIATVEGDSEFSHFPGIDRYLMPLSPAGLTLDFGAHSEQVGEFETWGFAGEVDVRSTGVTEKSYDLNLMIRRGAIRGSLVSERVSGELVVAPRDNETLVIVVGRGPIEVGDATLRALDAMDVRRETRLRGTGVVAIARIQVL